MPPNLPIDVVLPDLMATLKDHGQAVLHAPPGAGKTTRVPLALLETGFAKGRILMLEPRRLATRAAAERLAENLGETVGQKVGYRMRGESQKAAKIEVITEGILTRMIQSDPELAGIGAVIFDEFHERSLHADFGLALCLEIRAALRNDLILLVMSATLDAAPIAELMGGAPVISSTGRAFPVKEHWLEKPVPKTSSRGQVFENTMADLVEHALSETSGGVLVFLPGEGEIKRVAARLKPRLADNIHLHTLYGALDFKIQRKAIQPAKSGRKVVLATSIAETSLTIEDIRVVVDGGRARRARFDPGSGMSRLVTERVTKAEATQRQGRAGRIAEGHCYKAWTKGEDGGLAPFPPAEIEAADLAPLLLETALWGARDLSELTFLTPPNHGAVAAAKSLLTSLGALDEMGAITAHGRAISDLPLHPRLAHMVLKGGQNAALFAAILSERDLISGTGQRPPVDLELRIAAINNPRQFENTHPLTINRATLSRIDAERKRLPKPAGPSRSLGAMAALAYPDRIGMRRKGPEPRYVLSGGKGAVLDATDPLANAAFIVATDLDGDQREARIRAAAHLTEHDLRKVFKEDIHKHNSCAWSHRDRTVTARVQEVLGALVLSDAPWRDCPPLDIAYAMCDGIRDLGLQILPQSKAIRSFLGRAEWLRARGTELPDCSESALLATLENWLAPHLGARRKPDELGNVNILDALKSQFEWSELQMMARLAPPEFTAPTGTHLTVDYSGAQPSVSVRLQEMFGLKIHPTLGPDRIPVLIELLSPARRPVQITADLPGFWRTSYTDVRKDMRGRYPKHPWPEDPTEAQATRKRKPSGT